MTREQFETNWAHYYPGSTLINLNYRNNYSNRWFRIHSLPASKRYAETNEEWNILLSRQNEIITDLFGEGSPIIFATGDFTSDDNTELHPLDSATSLTEFSFTTLEPIDLYKMEPGNYSKGQFFNPIFCEQIWQPNKFDNVLKDIADDNLVGFFISFKKKYIIAPYDGGVDIIVDDSKTRDFYKNKYKSWLSARQDGL